MADIYDELMYFGAFYTMEVESNDFNAVDQLHNSLLVYFNGSYDVGKIMTRVRSNYSSSHTICNYSVLSS